MAFSRSRPAPVAPPDTTGPLVPFHELPEAARLLGISRALNDAKLERERALDLIAIEAELARPSSGSAKGPRAQMMRDRAARLREQAPAPKVEALRDDTLPPSISRALALLAGETIAEEPDRAAKIKRLREEVRILEAALGQVEELISELRAEESRKVSESLLRRHRAILGSVYEAAMALSAAIETERALYAEVLTAGYDGRPDILRRPGLDGASRLGQIDHYDSQIATFRRRLEADGVI